MKLKTKALSIVWDCCTDWTQLTKSN